jgi:hypothetical protein
MELNTKRIEDGVILEVADRILDEDDIRSMARKAIQGKIDAFWKTTVEENIQEIVNTAIREGFDHEYQRVTSFGEPVGEKTTIKKELEKQIQGYWSEKVDAKGKVETGYYKDKALTRAEWVMSQIVIKDFHAGMEGHIASIGGALKDHLRLSLHETVNEMLSGIFRVKSLDEQRPGGPPK